jgi:hypothetical protein
MNQEARDRQGTRTDLNIPEILPECKGDTRDKIGAPEGNQNASENKVVTVTTHLSLRQMTVLYCFRVSGVIRLPSGKYIGSPLKSPVPCFSDKTSSNKLTLIIR